MDGTRNDCSVYVDKVLMESKIVFLNLIEICYCRGP